MKPKKIQFITLTNLKKKRGWTDSLIRDFLGNPDQVKTNPRFASAAPMKLFEEKRVKRVEKSPKFKQAQAGCKGRREAAQKALATKRKKIDAYVEQVKIEVPQMERDKLIQCACNSFNVGRDDGDLARPDSAPGFLARICVNYLRHEMTEYEHHLDLIAGKVGARDAYLEIKEKVLEAIGDQYDWLADECDRQENIMREKEMEEFYRGES